MAANRIKALWKDGKPAINVFVTIPHGYAAEVIGAAGWDGVTVDMQHGPQDYASTLASFQALAGLPVTPMVRVPWNEPGIIGKVLDAGAYGVICPMVNTVAEATQLV